MKPYIDRSERLKKKKKKKKKTQQWILLISAIKEKKKKLLGAPGLLCCTIHLFLEYMNCAQIVRYHTISNKARDKLSVFIKPTQRPRSDPCRCSCCAAVVLPHSDPGGSHQVWPPDCQACNRRQKPWLPTPTLLNTHHLPACSTHGS